VKKHLALVLAVLFACSDPGETSSVAARGLPPGATITVTDLRDECLDDPTDCSVIDGDCSIREALNAARNDSPARPRDACPVGTANTLRDIIVVPLGPNGLTGTTTLAGPALEDMNNGGDLDIAWYNIELRGPAECASTNRRACWKVNASQLDRGIHAANSTGQMDVRISGVEVYNGCANGGYPACATNSPFGGAIYLNVGGSAILDRVFLHDSRASNGGSCLRTCAGDTTPTQYLVSNVEVWGCYGSPAIQTHVPGEWANINVHDNTIATAGANGSFDMFSKTSTCTSCAITNNVNLSGASAGYSIRGSSSLRARLLAYGGSVTGNVANGDGGGVYLNGSCAREGAQSYGCSAVFTNTAINGNTADSPTTSPTGNGGGVWISTAGAWPSRMELRGTTSVSSNSDLSSASYGPDCWGTVYTYGSASVGNPAGCTIVPQGAVCGNGTLESGEQCDDGNTQNGDCCSSACLYESSSGSCSDGSVCTAGDHCNGAGACLSGSGTPCGDGTLQAQCGEGCDDGNTADFDGCHSNCQPETCTGWGYP
jgi:cysteine-rich repeat protein